MVHTLLGWQEGYLVHKNQFVPDIAVFVLKRDAKLQPTNQPQKLVPLFPKDTLSVQTVQGIRSSDFQGLSQGLGDTNEKIG